MADTARPRRDLTAALLAALRAGCPVAPAADAPGNPASVPVAEQNQAFTPDVALVAPVAPLSCATVVAPVPDDGPDPVDAEEREAIAAEPSLPPAASRARARLDRRQRRMVAGLLAAARQRPSGPVAEPPAEAFGSYMAPTPGND